MKAVRSAWFLLFLGLIPTLLVGADSAQWRVAWVAGTVRLTRPNEPNEGVAAQRGQQLAQDTVISTGSDSSVRLEAGRGGTVLIAGDAKVSIMSASTKRYTLRLISGTAVVFSRLTRADSPEIGVLASGCFMGIVNGCFSVTEKPRFPGCMTVYRGQLQLSRIGSSTSVPYKSPVMALLFDRTVWASMLLLDFNHADRSLFVGGMTSTLELVTRDLKTEGHLPTSSAGDVLSAVHRLGIHLPGGIFMRARKAMDLAVEINWQQRNGRPLALPPVLTLPDNHPLGW